MSVLIKGVTKIELMKALIQSTYFLPDDIEIIEVPTPHGGLIDVNALDHDLDEKWNILDDADFANRAVWNALKYAPIVIESEE